GWSKVPRFHVMVIGNDMNCHKDILSRLDISPKNKVTSVDQSDVIMAFVPIGSRAGTDIQAALQKIPENRPVVFMALHHTFNPDYIAPDSSRAIRRSNVFSVDLLYHEDQGMLNCKRNTEALEATKKYLQDIQVNYNDKLQSLRFHVMVIGNDMNCHKDILSRLDISPKNKVTSVDQSDVIMAFVPIVSRAGTDIQAALQKIPVGQPKVLRFHVMVIGNDMNCHKDILSRLDISPQNKVISADQSDVIMAFVPIVSRAGTDIQAALQKIPENRPVVFMALHHMFNPDYIAPDSSRAIHRSNVFSVDLLYHEDQGMLNCKRNTEALEATKKYLQNIQECLCDRVRNRGDVQKHYSFSSDCYKTLTPETLSRIIHHINTCTRFFNLVTWRVRRTNPFGRSKVLRFHVMVIGNDMNCHKDILSRLGISSQDEEISVYQSDIIMAFVPIVSRAGTDIQAALQKIPENRPVVFMVLHHTFNPDYIAPDSSREIHRSNVFSVDLLYHEDQGMLNCKRNTEALEATKKYLQNIQQVVVWIMKAVGRPKVLRFHVMVIGNDMNCHKDILSRLDISSQDEEISADQSDVIIAFVPIVSRAGTDIQAALQKIPENRPVVFMVLHHTFDPDYIAPDSSREIRRSNVFSVDLLFHEDQGMLKCKRNTEALDKAKKYLQDIQVNYNDKLQCMTCDYSMQYDDYHSESRVLAFYIMALGNTLGGQIDFLDRLKQRVRLCQVYSEDECDVIIAYLCVVSRAGTDISAALEKIPTEKPALLVVFHHTFDENYIAPDSRWIVKRNGVLAVDVLFYEDTGMLRSLHNDEALKLSTDYLISLGASQDVLRFLRRLRQRLQLTEACTVDNCDVIIAFVPIVSRAGTDIEAALQKIPRTDKNVVLVGIHFTFDENYVAPNSQWNINRSGVFAVDLLCYEDLGMLRSLRNDQALKAVTDHLISIGGSPNTQNSMCVVCAWEPSNVPAADIVLKLYWPYAAPYLDNVVIHFSNWSDHLHHLGEVIVSLRKAGLTVNPKKCHLVLTEESKAQFGVYIFPFVKLLHHCHRAKKRVFLMNQSDKLLNVQNGIMDRLKRRLEFQQVDSVDMCDVIVTIVPIVSRAGTDIQAALRNIPREPEDSEVDSFITQAEVTEVVQQLIGGKAPGVDEIRPEYLNSLDVVGLSWLTRLCNIAWQSGTVPLDWATGVVVPLFKKGDRNVCSNYRSDTSQVGLCTVLSQCFFISHKQSPAQQSRTPPAVTERLAPTEQIQREALARSFRAEFHNPSYNLRFFVKVLGNTMNSHKTFLDRITISPRLCEVFSMKDSDVIFAFVPIVSRASTDIEAAVEKLPQSKPVVLVALHHTFNPDYVAPDSRACVNKERVFAVDCLFYEDQGLLNCLRNEDAIRAVKKHLTTDNSVENNGCNVCAM
ncbi:hypothetical protein QTP86_028687, partial [Hemibagrus guttatus]